MTVYAIGGSPLALVMEYVPGESLDGLMELARLRREAVPARVAAALTISVLHGLHAAHEALSERGEALGIVHRDVSPDNILVGADGVPRVFDFGIAKAIGRLRSTPSGLIKGKVAYIAPEQLRGLPVDRRTDVYGASCVLWELLCGRPLFDGPSQSTVLNAVLSQPVPAPSSLRADVPEALDRIVTRGLSREPGARFSTAHEMALALEREVGTVTQSELSAWLHHLAGERLAERSARLQNMVDRTHDGGLPARARSRMRPYWFALAAGGAALAVTIWSLLRATDPFVARPLSPSAPPATTARAARMEDSRPLQVGAPAPAPASKPPQRTIHRTQHECSPPYVVDRIGVRHPKPECL